MSGFHPVERPQEPNSGFPEEEEIQPRDIESGPVQEFSVSLPVLRILGWTASKSHKPIPWNK